MPGSSGSSAAGLPTLAVDRGTESGALPRLVKKELDSYWSRLKSGEIQKVAARQAAE